MEEQYSSSAKDIQKKFREWFGDFVSANPSFPAEENHSNGELQKKFHAWFSDLVSADPPLPVEENHSDLQNKFNEWFGDSVSADPPLPAEANHSTVDPSISDEANPSTVAPLIRIFVTALKNFSLRAKASYLSISLFIGMSTIGLLFTGMLIPPGVAALQPTETATSTSTIHPPTSTYTPTPTLVRPTLTAIVTDTTATPTISAPTPTFSNILMWSLGEGLLSQVGPLELGGQVRVYEASLKYVRTSPHKSRRLGEQINGPGYGAPSNICGPLSISILQEAGIVNPDLDPHAYWMLNPDDLGARKLLAQAFPPETFGSSRIRGKLDEIDWNENPLYPGDFVYLYAGSGGNFEHMLVVNRVDSQGRAYAVTNHNTEDGFIITEILLYDPDRSDLGMFSSWTIWPNAELGSTGFGGFEVWRLREPSGSEPRQLREP